MSCQCNRLLLVSYVAKDRWLPATRRSDHGPFWDQGYRAVLVTNTAVLRNPQYPPANVAITSLDLNFMT
jgi:aminopeptidase YwaD